MLWISCREGCLTDDLFYGEVIVKGIGVAKNKKNSILDNLSSFLNQDVRVLFQKRYNITLLKLFLLTISIFIVAFFAGSLTSGFTLFSRAAFLRTQERPLVISQEKDGGNLRTQEQPSCPGNCYRSDSGIDKVFLCIPRCTSNTYCQDDCTAICGADKCGAGPSPTSEPSPTPPDEEKPSPTSGSIPNCSDKICKSSWRSGACGPVVGCPDGQSKVNFGDCSVECKHTQPCKYDSACPQPKPSSTPSVPNTTPKESPAPAPGCGQPGDLCSNPTQCCDRSAGCNGGCCGNCSGGTGNPAPPSCPRDGNVCDTCSSACECSKAGEGCNGGYCGSRAQCT